MEPCRTTPVALGPDILRFMRENAHEHEAMRATEEEDEPPAAKPRTLLPSTQSAEEWLMDLELRRHFFAEDLQAVCNLTSQSLVDAFATIPRERYPVPGTLEGSRAMAATRS